MNKDSVNAPEIWDEIYRKTDFAPGWDKPKEDYNLKALIEKHGGRGKALLDVGCGNGRNRGLAQDYTGVDFAPSAVDYSQGMYPQGRFFLQNMVEDLTGSKVLQGGPYPVVIDCGCFHAIPPEKLLVYKENILRLISSEGLLIIGAWYRKPQVDKKVPQYHPFLYLSEWFYNEGDIEDFWKPEFELVEHRVDRDIYPGLYEGFGYFVLVKK